MPFYNNSQKLEGLDQGDILSGVPFTGFDLSAADIIVGNKISQLDFTNFPKADQGFLSAMYECSFGLVVNQSCNLSNTDPIVVARIYPLSRERIKDYREGNPQATINALKNPGRSPNLFYLPDFDQGEIKFPKSFVSLLEVQCFPPMCYSSLCKLRVMRLVPAALQALQERFAYCFGRYAAPDDLYD